MEKKVLLVDDEEGIRKVLGISLADAGWNVDAAGSGEEALRIFQEAAPSIVLTDIKMPGISGVELLKEIKALSPQTEVIMISGHGDMDLAIESLKFDACDFITKPIDDEVLEIALRRATEKIEMREQLRAYTENLEEMVREKSARLVEAERQAAACQVIEGFSGAIRNIADDLEHGIPFFNEMPCFVSIHNRDLKVVSTNELYSRRLGNKVGKDSWDVYLREDIGRDNCPVCLTFKDGLGKRCRETLRCVNGNELPVVVHTAPIRSSGTGVELVLEIAADIREVQRLQEDLADTQRRFQQLFDAAPCYISVQDRDLNVTAVNRRFREDFGDAVGALCYKAYKHREAPCPDCPIIKTFEDGGLHQIETVVTNSRGEQKNVLVWTSPILNAEGEITHVMELSTDITQIRQLQDHLANLGLLVGSLSHGVKGLLTGLDGGMYKVSSGFRKEDMAQVQEGWEVVKLMVSRIRSMVLDILYYAKERELNWEKVDVLSFVKDLAMTVAPKMHEHGIEFVTDFDETVGEFEVDTGVVRNALINILENAVDACLMDRAKPHHKVEFIVKQCVEHIIFDVRDNGIGMDRETRDRMFTLFFSSKGSKGTGLGMFISDKIIRQHDGEIFVESEQGKGSRFYILMPKILPDGAKLPPDEARKALGDNV